ncbi:MAG: fibronectin type III domain-containing protein [Bacteroidetes bacterium]|nr:fibronectin type III domain-containing protein [Bacteroidota bacterium]
MKHYYQHLNRQISIIIGIIIIFFVIKLGLKNKSVAEIIILARRIITMMTGNPNFPIPNPTLADLILATDALEAAQTDMDGARSKTVVRNLRLKELKRLLALLYTYVEHISMGDVVIALSSGFEMRATRNPIGILPAPATVEVKNTVVTGKVSLRWKKVEKSSGYWIEWTQDITMSVWPNAKTSKKAKVDIADLTLGERYYFRVATISSEGYEGFSDVITLRINFN